MVVLFSLLSGLLFGTGLLVSGMANPAKVLGFLDITRAWDPSLALVMGGAVIAGLVTFWLASRRKRPVFEETFYLPATAHWINGSSAARPCLASAGDWRASAPARRWSCSAAACSKALSLSWRCWQACCFLSGSTAARYRVVSNPDRP